MADLTFSPSLPWPRGGSGTITLNNGNSVTAEQLLAGKLKFEVTINGETIDTHVGEDTSGDLHLENDNDEFLYYLQIQQDGTVVTLTAESAGASITSVRLGTLRHAVEVFADEACTQKPQVEEQYTSLFVRFNKEFEFGSGVIYTGEGDGNNIRIITPDNEYPDDSYLYFLYMDWESEGYPQPFTAGQVIESTAAGLSFLSHYSTEFGPEVYV